METTTNSKKSSFRNFSSGTSGSPMFPFREARRFDHESDPYDVGAAQNEFVNLAGMPSQPTEPGMTA